MNIILSIHKSGDYDLIVYGHTHEPDVRKVKDTLIVNPGEAGAWLYGKATVALADLETMKAEIIRL